MILKFILLFALDKKNNMCYNEIVKRANRITDHRIGHTIHSLEAFLNGEIDDMIDALATADTAERLRSSGNNE